MHRSFWLVLLATCGGAPAPSSGTTPPPPVARASVLVTVPDGAVADVDAASFLRVAADGALSIGTIDGAIDLETATGRSTTRDGLVWWTDPAQPPLEEPSDEPFATLTGTGDFGMLDTAVSQRACGDALQLDAAGEAPVALIVAEANTSAESVLDAIDVTPRPIGFAVSGGRALRYTVDTFTVITGSYGVEVGAGMDAHDVRTGVANAELAGLEPRPQAWIRVGATATAADLLVALAGLALAGVEEVVIDRGDVCGGVGGYGTIGGIDAGGGRPAVQPRVTLGNPSIQGDGEKAILRRYLRRNLAKIRYCYEKQLLASPDLAGALELEFLVNADGTVASATAKGFDATVDGCVAGVVKAIAFPATPAGGLVKVTWPIDFHPTGG